MRFLLFLALLLFPKLAFAVETEVGDVQTFGELISKVWAWSTQIIFGVSVIVLIVGGIMYMAARGDEERVNTAREVVSGSIIATVLTLLSGVLFTFLHKPTANIQGAATLSDATQVLQNIASILLGVVGGVCALMLIYSGVQYMLAAGEQEKIDSAKKGLFFSVVGLAISLSAYGIIQWVISIQV